jgi:hypothetical protein
MLSEEFGHKNKLKITTSYLFDLKLLQQLNTIKSSRMTSCINSEQEFNVLEIICVTIIRE